MGVPDRARSHVPHLHAGNPTAPPAPDARDDDSGLPFPEEVFTRVPYAPTLEGQYIIKNIVLIAAGLVIGATVRGGRVIADPRLAESAGRQAEHVPG